MLSAAASHMSNLVPGSAPVGVANVAVQRSLKLSVLDGLFHAAMVGISESYIGAFAVYLGHDDAALALLLTLPVLVGALCQLLTATFVRWVGSRKRVVVFSAFGQALSHLLLLHIALEADTRFAPLMIAAVLFWGFGSLLAPAWSGWMGALTRQVDRESYFARRSAAINVMLLLAFGGAGFALARLGASPSTFAWMFVAAMLARLVSVVALALKVDPDVTVVRAESSFLRARAALQQGRFRVAAFVAVMMFGANVSVPFFTPYMLRTLDMGIWSYSMLLGVAIASKAVSFALWRRVGERFGMRAVLLTSVFLMAWLPVQWVWFPSTLGLSLVQIVSGMAWGGFEFAALQLMLRDAPEGLEVEFFSLANSGSGVLQVAGALFGSALLLLPGASYHTVFIGSSIARGLSILLLIPIASELYSRGPLPALFTRLVSVLPSGAVRRPVVLDDPPKRDLDSDNRENPE